MPPKVLVFLPCYKRPEYTQKCIAALEAAQSYGDNVCFYLVDDGSGDGTHEILEAARFKHKMVHRNDHNEGLRNTIIKFFHAASEPSIGVDYIVKLDNDCLVPANWLTNLLNLLDKGQAEIISPNVLPSNAAMKYGSAERPGAPGLRPSKLVGGLWAMPVSLLEGIFFEPLSSGGIKGAWHLLNQIIVEKEPRIAWASEVAVQDIGHWTGEHPEHVKSQAHLDYSVEVGRKVAWA